MTQGTSRAPCGCPYEWFMGQNINRDKILHQGFCPAVPRYCFLDRDDTVKFVEAEFARLRTETETERELRFAADKKLGALKSALSAITCP